MTYLEELKAPARVPFGFAYSLALQIFAAIKTQTGAALRQRL